MATSYASPSSSSTSPSQAAINAIANSNPNPSHQQQVRWRAAHAHAHTHTHTHAHAHAAPSRSQSVKSKSRPTETPPPPYSASPRRSNTSSSRSANNARPDLAQSSRSKDGPVSPRQEPSRSRSGHRRPSRFASDMTTTANSNGGGPAPVVVPQADQRMAGSSGNGKSRRTIPARTGTWVLGKTIGAGSMGKVKLARRQEGGEEQVAVKIVPRGIPDDNHSQSRADQERAEKSKEVRTAREAAIVTLLDHPYICAMRDVVRTNFHWYMLFEYVNGGQMLDYIISHGRLKEKQARKFSRQIASSLDYCHRNSIVHRDLKIENILISKTGDIKIIDFGLSNLFSPKGHLKTFCGSLYFAAPELLQAKQYTGPEVDIWSFGIVLYVLVCGKVPFDDQSMPALHAKIKKGVVDYPNWLSTECKTLISKMLVTDPKQRATLQEILNHPWMLKGYSGPPENYLPAREPLTLPLDPEVIAMMTGFDFGPADVIVAQLTDVIQSPEYVRAARMAAHERETAASARDPEKKSRGFGFDFYKRRNSTTSRDTLTGPSSEGLQLGTDPTNAYHPLTSVYYLCAEKKARDRSKVNPGATSMPRVPGEAPLQVPDIVAPKAAYTNSATYEMPGEKATGGRSRPRARTHGEDEVTEGMKHVKIAGSEGHSGPTSPPAVAEPENPRKESTATGFLRRFSTRRRKEPIDRHIEKPPHLAVQPVEPTSSLRKSFSVRRTKSREEARRRPEEQPPAMSRAGSSQPQHSDLLEPPPLPKTQDEISRSTNMLGRSTSVAGAELRRRDRDRKRGATTSETHPPRVTYKSPPPTGRSDVPAANDGPAREPDIKNATSPQSSSSHRAKSLGHARRESIQARRARREEAREANVPEETDVEAEDVSGMSNERVDHNGENVKPFLFKGIFSVSTTSNKALPVITADITRVLKLLGVDYYEIRGGFNCRHRPSIDLNKVVDLPPSSHGNTTPGMRRKMSFGGARGASHAAERDREDFREAVPSPRTPRTPGHSRQDSSYDHSGSSSESISNGRGSPSRAAPGETRTHVSSDLGGSMVLEFEILIVKVPMFSLHGIQFKRLAGGTWQYKNMADQILKELRL